MFAAAAHLQWLDEDVANFLPPETSSHAPPPRIDAELSTQLAHQLAAVARGDQRAFERFYDATLARVFGVARRICSDAALAEEVTEDVYVQVWREAARFDAARGAVLAWLLMMTRSRALDALRRADPAVSVEDPHVLGEEDDLPSHDDPLHLLEVFRRDGEVRSALAALPARDRQMVALAFMRGLTHAEIAAAMRLPLGTVKTTIRRALATLRARLALHAPEGFDGEAGDDDE